MHKKIVRSVHMLAGGLWIQNGERLIVVIILSHQQGNFNHQWIFEVQLMLQMGYNML
jgi:hypothetical protein